MRELVPIFVFIVGFYFALGKITITELRVPQSLNNEDPPENVTLDCVYEVSGESNIVLKWFFKTTENMIYQWIPSKEPASLGMFKDIVDENYKATEDEETMYRALHITRISPNITGHYFCKVSGDRSEALVAKKLVVYEPPVDGLTVEHDESNNTVTCFSSGVFPEPELKFCIIEGNDSYCHGDDFVIEPSIQIVRDEDNKYNITGFVEYNETLLSDGAVFYCNLSIPDTDFYLEESFEFHPETFELGGDYPAWFYEVDSTATTNNSKLDDNDNIDEGNVTSKQDNSVGSITLSLPLVLTAVATLWMNW